MSLNDPTDRKEEKGEEEQQRTSVERAYGYLPFSLLDDASLSWRSKLIFAFRATFAGGWILKISGTWGLQDCLGLGRDYAYRSLSEYRRFKGLEQPRDEFNRFAKWQAGGDVINSAKGDTAFIVRRAWFDGSVKDLSYYVLLHVAAFTKKFGRVYEGELLGAVGVSKPRLKARLAELVRRGFIQRLSGDCFRLQPAKFLETGNGYSGSGNPSKSGDGISGDIPKTPRYTFSPINTTQPESLNSTTPHSSPAGDECGGRVSNRLDSARFLGGVFEVEFGDDYWDDVNPLVRDAMDDIELIDLLIRVTRERALPHLLSQDGCDVVRTLASCILATEAAYWMSTEGGPRIAIGIVLQAFEDRIGARGDEMAAFGIVGKRILAGLREYDGETRFYKNDAPPLVLWEIASKRLQELARRLLSVDRADVQRELHTGIEERLHREGLDALETISQTVQAMMECHRGAMLPADVLRIIDVELGPASSVR